MAVIRLIAENGDLLIAQDDSGYLIAENSVAGGPILTKTSAYWEITPGAAADLYGGKITLKWESTHAMNHIYCSIWANGIQVARGYMVERAHSVGGGFVTDTFFLQPCGVRLNAGEVVRVQIDSVAHQQAPMPDGNTEFEFQPLFTDNVITIDRAGTKFEFYTVAAGTEEI